jgi:UDP-N-acetylmuramate dehydrogenase
LGWRNTLKSILSKPPLEEEPLSLHTSLRIGGPAEFLVFPSNLRELQEILKLVSRYEIPFGVIGKGTNLLVRDGGVRGILINISNLCSGFQFTGINVKSGAGVPLPLLARAAINRGLQGLEFAIGIPGSVGGAIYMNAGAFGYSIGALLQKVVCLDYKGNLREYSKDRIVFSYRYSSLQEEKIIILQAVLTLSEGEREELLLSAKRMQKERRLKQPSLPSAGSIFRNPPGYAAGYLIEQTGLKGMTVGGAQISTKHANFIVNKDNATARDVLALIGIIREKVKESFNINLELEIEIIGENGHEQGEN